MNVRQVVSILLSYITYHHFITAFQVVGLCLVFGALFYKSYKGLTTPKEKKDEQTEEKGKIDEKAPLIPKSGEKEKEPSEYSTAASGAERCQAKLSGLASQSSRRRVN